MKGNIGMSKNKITFGEVISKRQELINSGNNEYRDRRKFPLKKIKELIESGEI